MFNMQFSYASRCSVTTGAGRKVSVRVVDPEDKSLLGALVSALVPATICFGAAVLLTATCQ